MADDRIHRNRTDRPKRQSTSGHPLEERPLPPTARPNPETRADMAFQETHTDALGSGQHAKEHAASRPDVPHDTVDDSSEVKPELHPPPRT